MLTPFVLFALVAFAATAILLASFHLKQIEMKRKRVRVVARFGHRC